MDDAEQWAAEVHEQIISGKDTWDDLYSFLRATRGVTAKPLSKAQWVALYHEYLISEDWQTVRCAKLDEQPSCEDCGVTQGLHVHHLSYDRLGREWLSDLQVLCADCHEAFHQFDADRKRVAARRAAVDQKKKRTQPLEGWQVAALVQVDLMCALMKTVDQLRIVARRLYDRGDVSASIAVVRLIVEELEAAA